MLLGTYYDALTLHRNNKKVYARFNIPHAVVSTCRINGGLRDDITTLLNHQSCEPCNHTLARAASVVREPEAYLERICREEDLDHTTCASLGTAANMNYTAVESLEFKELTVVAVATGGVEANAGRAGDPAHYHETDGTFIHESHPDKKPTPGTINIMVFINRTLNRGALVRAIITATEAKSAALQELSVNSRYSPELATGTGTDQMGIACQQGDEIPLTSSGKHTKLGELIGKTVKKAVKRTLKLQNELTPQGQRSIKIHIERLGTDKTKMLEGISKFLDEKTATLLKNNFDSVNRDPLAVAAAAALMHLRDKWAWGILPKGCMKEIWSSQGAQLAAAVSGNIHQIPDYYQRLSQTLITVDDIHLLQLLYQAMAMGFKEKWKNN
ncbi:Adenosylcobinamide amidohydrolase [Desulfocicer vacuolatum DSM 3385]|uniref:Adenosylcobinamide amidohydrolase n=1 Tax=Desulfocicer vacuolatum DSM 3385 TaxID=1121400 RepID=A0A1W1YTF7_9BACT|nr:adenosylcobinamide amidohydrolase [Desulfocicer vacuolatum]SMC39439.1 Adenosylcobinamide amidohydrolase [Desulfocicer vacuolatum DSM 3385]